MNPASARGRRSPRGRALFGACGLVAWWGVVGCGVSAPDVGARDGGGDGAAQDAGVQFLDAALDASPVPSDAGATVDAAAASCVATPCDPRLARPCGADATSACRLGPDGPRCVGEIGMQGLGTPCLASEECGPGLDCFAEPGGAGRCERPCCAGEAEACPVGARCEAGARLVDGSATTWGRCVLVRACEVLAPERACEPGEGCYIVSPGGATDCRPAGSVPVGAPCDAPADCVPGAFCAGLMARTCVRICALGGSGATGCPAGEGSCRAYPYSPPGTGVCS